MKRKFYARPFETHYASQAEQAGGHGFSATEQGAIRAAVVRIFLSQYASATIYNRSTGVALYTITVGPQGLRVSYGTAVPLRRVK